MNESGSARIQDLALRLHVTQETIRRTVAMLEQQGIVTKVHGGVSLKNWGLEPSFEQRFVQNQLTKRRIAEAVASLIKDGASLILDVGSTTAYVARARARLAKGDVDKADEDARQALQLAQLPEAVVTSQMIILHRLLKPTDAPLAVKRN